MGIIEFWKNRNYWQKGAIIGAIFGFLSYTGPLVYTIITSPVSIPKPSILMMGYILLSVLMLSGAVGVFFGLFGFLIGVVKKEDKSEIEIKEEKPGLKEFFKPNKKKIAFTLLLLWIAIAFLVAYTILNFEVPILFIFPLLLFKILPTFVLIIFVLLAYIFSCYISESKRWIRGIIFYLIIFIIIFTVTPFTTTSNHCETNSDCVNAYCCGCMNKNSVCGSTLPWRSYNIDCMPNFGPCSCIDNVCREVYYENFNTVEECHELNNVDACINNLALRSEDIKICESIKDGDIKIQCKEKLTKEENITIEFCNLYTDQGNKNICLRNLVERLNESSLCYEMEPKSAKENCLVEFGFLTSPEDCEKLKEYKANCYYRIAERLNNPSFCDKIDTDLHRDSCITKFAQSIDDCDKVKSDWMKEDCVSKFLSSLESKCSDIKEDYAKLECYINLAQKVKDIDICDKPEDFKLRETCKFEFVASLTSVEECEKTGGFRAYCYTPFAKKLNDPEICHRIPWEQEERLCLIEFVTDVEECKTFEGEYSRSKCYYKFAFEARDLALCDSIEDEGWRKNCVDHINSIKNCETMEGSYEGQSLLSRCYYNSAINWGDISLCNKIEDDKSFKDRCISIISSKEGCEATQDMYLRSDCYYDIALNFKLLNLCDKIINASLRNDCITEVEKN